MAWQVKIKTLYTKLQVREVSGLNLLVGSWLNRSIRNSMNLSQYKTAASSTPSKPISSPSSLRELLWGKTWKSSTWKKKHNTSATTGYRIQLFYHLQFKLKLYIKKLFNKISQELHFKRSWGVKKLSLLHCLLSLPLNHPFPFLDQIRIKTKLHLEVRKAHHKR